MNVSLSVYEQKDRIMSFHLYFFFFNDTATTEIYTLSLHDALPISLCLRRGDEDRLHHHGSAGRGSVMMETRSEEHTSELQSLRHLVCRLLLEKKNRELAPTFNM